MGELVFTTVMGLFMLFFIVDSGNIADMGGGDPIGPAGFPVLIAGLGLALLCIIAFQSFRNRKGTEGGKKGTGLSRAAILTTVLLALFVPALDILGFIVSSFVLLSAMVFIFGCGSIQKSLLIGFLGSAGAVLLFGRILHVALPRGLALFRVLSYHIY